MLPAPPVFKPLFVTFTVVIPPLSAIGALENVEVESCTLWCHQFVL